MRITIIGVNMPTVPSHGEDGAVLTAVHVALQDGREPGGPVPVSAGGATWEVEVRTVVTADGTVDLRGSAVHGRRGERFLYLTWGDVDRDGGFAMFRRAKLMLDRVDPAVRGAAEAAGRLACEVDLSGADGTPRCARVDPPAVRWWVPDGAGTPGG